MHSASERRRPCEAEEQKVSYVDSNEGTCRLDVKSNNTAFIYRGFNRGSKLHVNMQNVLAALSVYCRQTIILYIELWGDPGRHAA